MKNIAIVAGGDSKEYDISIQSSKQVSDLIDEKLFNTYTINIKGLEWNVIINNEKIPIDKNDFSVNINNKKILFNCALIIIHGTPGENGLLQAYFQLLKIPFTTCNFFESALCFNKYACKVYLKKFDILSAKSIKLRKDSEIKPVIIIGKLGLPCFVKPNAAGSSFGITKVNDINKLKEAIELAFKEDYEVIVEEFIDGREITNGVIKTSKNNYILPVTEIVTKNDFFDYDAKYSGETDEITPAKIPDDITEKCKQISSDIYDILNCSGIVRVDYILKGNDLYFLEINTVPGMSKESIIPQQAREMNVNLTNVYTEIIYDAIGK